VDEHVEVFAVHDGFAPRGEQAKLRGLQRNLISLHYSLGGFERTLGVAIPVQGLSAWLRGRARAGTPGTVERDAQGRPAVLRQDGWEIVYAYPDDATPKASRLTLRYEQGQPAEVRLIIDRWQ